MGTRSDIIVQRADGKWARIYCHWDGYLSNNGRILFEHYNTQDKAEALVALGDMSALGEVIGEKHDFDYQQTFYAKKYKGEVKGDDGKMRKRTLRDPKYQRLRAMCNVYGRDRGESDVDAKIGDSLQDVWPEADTWTKYTYVWTREHGNPEGQWLVGDPDEGTQTLKLLGEALEADRAKAEAEALKDAAEDLSATA